MMIIILYVHINFGNLKKKLRKTIEGTILSIIKTKINFETI